MKPRRALLPLLVAAALLLSACTEQSIEAHAEVISAAVAAYDRTYFTIVGLTDQLRAGSEAARISKDEAVYTVQALLPDYPSLDLSGVAYRLPDIDFTHVDASQYRTEAKSAMADAVRAAARAGAFPCSVPAELTFRLSRDTSGVWQADFDEDSARALAERSETSLALAVDAQFQNPAELRLVEIASRGKDVLRWIFEGDGFIDACAITHVSFLSDGEYRMAFTYPDLKPAFQALSARMFESYNAEFYGKAATVRLKAENSTASLLKGIPASEAEVRVLYSGTGDPVPADYDALWESYYRIKTAAEADVTARVNAKWYVPMLERPRSGTLTGRNSGISLKVRNKSTETDLYLRFFRISGTSISQEDGVFTQDLYVRKGESASMRIPKGNYRMLVYTGSDWYGPDHAFGPDGSAGLYGETAVFDSDYTYSWDFGADNGTVPILPID